MSYGILKKMRLLSDTSLFHKAAVAVISSLWNEESICMDIKNYLLGIQECKFWKEIESHVFSNLVKIYLPDPLKLYLTDLIELMGNEVLKWIEMTQSVFRSCPQSIDAIHFIWFNNGTLDYIKTAELIIHHNPSKKVLCFCLACIFCIEEVILMLWPDVKSISWEQFISFEFHEETFLVEHWTKYLNNRNEYQTFFEYHCKLGYFYVFNIKCLPLLNYFVKNLDEERKRLYILKGLQYLVNRRRFDGNVLIFLFSHVNESDIHDLISKNALNVLSSLLVWPCHEFFMSVANSSWNYIPISDYLNLFMDILEYISRFPRTAIYKNLLKEFWLSSPPSFKEYIKSKCVSGTFLSRLFLFGSLDIIQMILNEITPEEKQKMIFYFEGMNLCDLLVKKKRWDSLKMLIQNCIPCSDILREFIIQYSNYRPSYYNEETELRTETLIHVIRDWYL